MSSATISISVPDDVLADEFSIYTRKWNADPGEPEEWSLRGSTRATTYRLDGLPSSGIVEIGIAPMSGGVEYPEGRWTTCTIECGDPEDFPTPADVTGFGAAQDGGMVRLRWQPVEVAHLSHYEIRVRSSGTTGDALYVGDVAAPATEASFGWMASGSQTWAIVAVTKHGKRSASEATSIVTIRADGDFMIASTTTEATTFGGTKTGCEVASSNLRPIAYSDYSTLSGTYTEYTQPYWSPTAYLPTYVTSWVDLGAVVDTKIETTLTYSSADVSASYADMIVPVHPDTEAASTNARDSGKAEPLDYVTKSGVLVNGTKIRIEIDTSQDGTPTPDGYREWLPGSVYRLRQYRLKVTWLNYWPYLRPSISALTHKAFKRNWKDEAAATITATGGTAISFAAPFSSAPKVVASSVGTSGFYATVEDITTSGCEVRLWDAAGTEQSSGTVHVIAAGV